MGFKKIFSSKIVWFFLASLSCLNSANLWSHQQNITEEELYRLEKMADDMLRRLSPEEREQALAMAQQMEQEIAQLPPEKLADVEAALKQDMQYLLSEDSPYKQFGNDSVPPVNQPEYQAPEPELPEYQELDQKTGPQKIKPKVVDPVKIQTTKLLLQNIIRNFDELLIKAQNLPRVSPNRAHESSWQTLHLEIMQLKSILAIVAEKPALMAQLLEAKYSNLYNNLQKLNKELSESTRKLPVLKKLDTIIDQLIKLELNQTRSDSQKLVKEFAPEVLNEFTPVGNKWHHADHGQRELRAKKIQEKYSLKPSSKQHKAKLAPHKLTEQLAQELTNLQNLIQETQLITQIENLHSSKISSKNKLNTPDKNKFNSKSNTKPNFNNSAERTTLRQLEADLIRVNLQYERLLRGLISVVGKSYQLAPQLLELMRTKVSHSDSTISKVKRLVSSTLAAEFELAEQIKKQLLKLEAQANELSAKISILVPAKTGPEPAAVKNLATKPGKSSQPGQLSKLPKANTLIQAPKLVR